MEVTVKLWIPALENANHKNPEAVLDVTIERIDNGIGPYEFWGSKETHHQWEEEIQDWSVVNSEEYNEEDKKLIFDYMDNNTEKIVELALKAAKD